MKKYHVFVFLIAIIIPLTAASCSLSSLNKGSTKVKEGEYHVGNQGLVINFLRNSPPSKMYEQTDFKIALELRNKGTCDVGPSSEFGCRGLVKVEGFDPTIIRGLGTYGQWAESPYTDYFTKEIPDMPGKSVYNTEGSYNTVTFPTSGESLFGELPEGLDKYPATILATACYTYLTEATPIVCVDPDPFGIQIEDKVCTIRDVTLSGGQGAPVAVTKVETNVIKEHEQKYLQFKIFVENSGNKGSKKTSSEGVGAVGTGIVVDPDAMEDEFGNGNCIRPQYSEINKVLVSGRLSGTEFGITHQGTIANCQPDTYRINLDDSGKGYIICKVQIPSSGEAYTAPLHIRLYYGYITTVSTSTEIVKIP